MIGYRKIDKPVIIYGYGELGRLFDSMLHATKQPVAFHMDRDSSVGGVIGPEDLSREVRGNYLTVICIASEPYSPIAEHLTALGYDVASVYDVFNAHPEFGMSNGWAVQRSFDKLSKTMEICNFFAIHSDSDSALAYYDFATWHMFRADDHDYHASTNDRYFIEPVLDALHDHEYFLDGGAHLGEVTDRFIELTGGQYEGITMIEPSRDAFLHLLQKCRSNDYRMRAHGVVLGKNGIPVREFYDRGYASKVIPPSAGCAVGAKRLVLVRSLAEVNIPATFIKLHLEGEEYTAIASSVEYLRKQRPMMAVTVYHNPIGLWQLEELLMRTFDRGYRYYFRNHAYQGQVAVMYCIPEERLQ